MNTLPKFKIYPGKRTRVAYKLPDELRKFIYADHVPHRKLGKLVNGANAPTPAARLRFMSRSLGYRDGGYSNEMLVDLMRKKIAALAKAARQEYRSKIDGTNKRAPQRSQDTATETFVWKMLAAVKGRISRRLDDLDTWDDETRAAVRVHLEKHERWISEVKAQI